MNLSDFISTSTVDSVAILDSDTLEPLFASAHPMRVSVIEEKRATKFAVEDGTERSDHVVKELTEIVIEFMLTDDTRNSFANIRQAWLDNKLVTVQTKVSSYESMLILSIPHDEFADIGDSISIPIRLQEWVEVKPQEGSLPQSKVANSNQTSTVKRGQVTATPTSTESETHRRGSILSGWF